MTPDRKTHLQALFLVLAGLIMIAIGLSYTMTHLHVPAGSDWKKLGAAVTMIAGCTHLFVGLVNLDGRTR